MPDCFISYSSKDQELANFVYDELMRNGLNVFMASVSLHPGENWTTTIREKLKESTWVILLASQEACRSPFVLQETGMAMITEKKVIPIVWDLSPSELPGWLNHNHALDLKNVTMDQIQSRITQIAQRIKADKTKGQLIAGAILFGLFLFATRS